jgi:serine/threonine-protein kinase
MLFEMLTGVQPHTGESPLAVAYKHVNAVVPAPSSINSDLPGALDALVALGTSRDPELRPPDARHYLKAITQVRRGLPMPTPGQVEPAAEMAVGPMAAGPAAAGIAAASTAAGQSATGPIAMPTGTAALFPPSPGTNHTMIVPSGPGHDGGDEDDDYQRTARRPRSRGYREPFLQRWLFSRRILILLAVLLVAGLGWWMIEGQYFTVPSVAGMSVSTARGDLTNAGLTVVAGTSRHSNTVPKGQVILIDPAAGSRIKHGGKVTLIGSLGPILISVPSVTGQQVDPAEQSLKSAGLTWSTPQYQTSASVPAGIVISTNPVAYTHWPQGKPVQLVVSAGPPLPDFKGGQVSAAQAAASVGGYTINAITVSKSQQPAGTVLRQSPAAGSRITAGEVVTVWVSPGPPQVNIPNVSGMNVNQAESALAAAGFNVTVNDVGPGHRVLSYSPTGTAPTGTTIAITVGLSF